VKVPIDPEKNSSVCLDVEEAAAKQNWNSSDLQTSYMVSDMIYVNDIQRMELSVYRTNSIM
jgi:hypothetical protein